MELLFAALGGTIIGLVVRYSLPGRDRMGALVVPAVATAGAAVIWEILTWAGMTPDGTWIWVITFGVVAVKCVFVDLWLSRRRKASDAEAFEAALKGGIAAR